MKLTRGSIVPFNTPIEEEIITIIAQGGGVAEVLNDAEIANGEIKYKWDLEEVLAYAINYLGYSTGSILLIVCEGYNGGRIFRFGEELEFRLVGEMDGFA